MSNFGLGLAAYEGYQARDRQVKAQDYQDRQREYGVAQMDANQPGLADAASAHDSANRLYTARNNAEAGLVPARTQLASTNIGLQQSDANLKTELKPRQDQTARQKTEMEGLKADQDFKTFPQALSQDLVSKAITNSDAQTLALAKLVDVIDAGSKGQVVQYANGIRDAGIFGDLKGPEIADVRMVKGPDGTERVALIDSAGNPSIALSADEMTRFRSLGKKFDYKVVGKSLVKTDARGNATPVFTSPEATRDATGHPPAEVATMDWMVKHGVAKDANEAFQKLRTARGKSKAEFISGMVKGSTVQGIPPSDEQLRQMEGNFGAMYDRLNGNGRASASNSNPANTLDPKVQSLFE